MDRLSLESSVAVSPPFSWRGRHGADLEQKMMQAFLFSLPDNHGYDEVQLPFHLMHHFACCIVLSRQRPARS